MQDAYNKRLNILIHELKENIKNNWESRNVTVEKFETFFKKQNLKLRTLKMLRLLISIGYLSFY